MPRFYDNDKNSYNVSDVDKLGEGGEARAYKFQHGVVKLYKRPNDMSLVGDESQDVRNRKGAKVRLDTFHEKIRAYPSGLPRNVITPKVVNGSSLALNGRGKPIGFFMDGVPDPTVLKRFSEPAFRSSGGISTESIMQLFIKIHTTIDECHRKDVIIGDNNDLNILVDYKSCPYMIDTDSFQFGKYLCYSFTQRFGDPLLCDPNKTALLLNKQHNKESDWYAFVVQLIQSLLYVGPYDGVYRSPKNALKIPHDARPLHRIHIFRDDVKYPKFASSIISPDSLPTDLMQEFVEILEKDKRGKFPVALLDLRMRSKDTAPAAVKSVTKVHGTMTSERIVKTPGIILCSVFQDSSLKYLYHDGGALKREDGSTVLHGRLDSQMRYRICGDKTCIAKGNFLVTLPGNDRVALDQYKTLPMYDANFNARYWLSNGRLLSDDGSGGIRAIGTTIQNQTLFWVGEKFGFGLYSAGELQEFFTFNCSGGIIHDGIEVPRIKGNLFDTTCVFSSDWCWFFASFQDSGRSINRCSVITKDGNVKVYTETQSGDGSWLGNIRGSCAVGHMLFSPTDEGITRVQLNSGALDIKEFPDTEPFVDSACLLLPGRNGLHVVSNNEIRTLRIA